MPVSVNWRILILLSLAAFVGCTWQSNTGPSTLVIAVENLAFERVSCESTDLATREFESFRVFCEDGIRFTHAFTTSTLSQAALASVLTGLYPLEHGLRSNGRDGLGARFTTVAEGASEKGFRTALFSGGPPILRKSGLAQGFEIFDDRFEVSENVFFRPGLEVARNFINWIDREVGKRGFFAVLFLADLQFPGRQTTSDLGEVRERSLDSQLREIAESLTTLIAELRRRDLWHRTNVILVGLNGQATRGREIPPLSVYADTTQVALFFKPARKGKDQGPQWTVDRNVSLADLGISLQKLVGSPPMEPLISQLPRVSIFSVADDINAGWDDDRLILVESGWGLWRGLSGIRYAARRRQYLYVHDYYPRIYNTLIDRLESNALPNQDPLWQTLRPTVLEFFATLELPRWSLTSENLSERISRAQQWWSPTTEVEPKLDLTDPQLRHWQAQRLIMRENWNGLLQLGTENREPLLEFVGRRNLNMATMTPKGPCGRFFASGSEGSNARRVGNVETPCDDLELVHLIESVDGSDRTRRENAGDLFVADFRARRTESEIGSTNYSMYLPWDVSLQLPRGAVLTDLFLALPENRSLMSEFKDRRLRENRAIDL